MSGGGKARACRAFSLHKRKFIDIRGRLREIEAAKFEAKRPQAGPFIVVAIGVKNRKLSPGHAFFWGSDVPAASSRV